MMIRTNIAIPKTMFLKSILFSFKKETSSNKESGKKAKSSEDN